MSITRQIFDFAKKVIVSQTALIFFGVQAVLLATAFLQKGTIQAVHSENEALLYKILFLINIPASIVTGILFLPILFLILPIANWLGYKDLPWLIVFISVGKFKRL